MDSSNDDLEEIKIDNIELDDCCDEEKNEPIVSSVESIVCTAEQVASATTPQQVASISSSSNKRGVSVGFSFNQQQQQQSKRIKKEKAEANVSYCDIAKELYDLTKEERDRILEEIHGVADIKEGTDLLEVISKFDFALKKLSKTRRRFVDRACFLRPNILTNTKFKLLFLRSTYCQIDKSIDKFASYFEMKHKLFSSSNSSSRSLSSGSGPGNSASLYVGSNDYYDDGAASDESCLVKDLTLQDLTTEEIQSVILNGHTMFLPLRDSTGRYVLYTDLSKIIIDYDNNNNNNSSIHGIIKCIWYMIMSILEEENDNDDESVSSSASKQGICYVMYYPSSTYLTTDLMIRKYISELFRSIGEILEPLPIRVTSFHLCSDSTPNKDEMLFFLQEAAAKGLGKQIRLRMRVHYYESTTKEVQDSLSTYGIHCQGILLVDDNDDDDDDDNITTMKQQQQRRIVNEIQQSYLQNRKVYETKRATKMIIQQQHSSSLEETTLPSSDGIIMWPNNPNDVLMGRGRSYQYFGGNIIYAKLLESQLQKYTSDQFSKMCISMDVVLKIKQSGGRFLSRQEGLGWKILNDVEAREKTSVAFRSKKSYILGKSSTATSPATSPRGGNGGAATSPRGSVGSGSTSPTTADIISSSGISNNVAKKMSSSKK